LGITLFTAEPQPQPRFTEPEVLTALERLRALQDGYRILTNATTSMALPVGREAPIDVFRHAVALEPHPDTRWPVRLLLIGVPQKGANIQMAWKWIAFLLERGGIHSNQMLSSIQTEAIHGAAQEELGNELHNAYLTALERDKTSVDLEGTLVQEIAATWFDQAIQDVGAGDLESALTQAQINAKQFIACQSGVPLDIQAIAACVQQVDPGHPLAKINLVQ